GWALTAPDRGSPLSLSDASSVGGRRGSVVDESRAHVDGAPTPRMGGQAARLAFEVGGQKAQRYDREIRMARQLRPHPGRWSEGRVLGPLPAVRGDGPGELAGGRS